MTYVYKKEMKLAPLEVEYVMSSVTNEIKIVDMYYGGEPTKSSYMSDESRLELMDELERDYLDREKETTWLEEKLDIAHGI
jgi:hypothetical protein|tara:strand:+ start:7 stop:249 length:243 start_codon:yes stop_codon:yes gene_type:complete